MELGRGGMGVVYLARQIELKRLVALKMILAGHHASPRELARFRAEAEAVARLQHPNIVQIHQIGEQEGLPFFSLEYVAGGSLDRRMQGPAHPPRAAAELLATLARAVHYAHERGIVHRDLKPSNILLATDGTPKITDFSLAKFLDHQASLTPTEAVIGTPNYMSPEQAAGHTRDVGPAADIFALGTILYELLTGRPPFRGTSLLDTLQQLRTQEPVPAARFCASLPRELDIITLKCLEKEPHRRYPSALHLAQDLERFLTGHAIHARRTPVWTRVLKWTRRRPTTAALIGVLLAGVVSLLAALPQYHRLSAQASQQRLAQDYREFLRWRDEAFFHGMMAISSNSFFTGSDLAEQMQQAAQAADRALHLAGVDLEQRRIALVPFGDTSVEQVRADCYALLLVRADATAEGTHPPGPPANRYAQALRLLDLAPRLGLTTRAYHLQRAMLLEHLDRAADAATERQQARQVPTRTALDHFLAGEALYRGGRTHHAAAEFNSALALRPEAFWTRFYLSVCHLRMQQWEAARAGLSACLVQQPDFVWIYLFRGLASERLHDLKAAAGDFEHAFHLGPAGDARYVLLLNRGVLYFEQKHLDQAAQDFREAVQLRPRQYNARLNLARVYLAQRKYPEAATEVEQARDLQPPPLVLAAYHLERARACYADKNYQGAADAAAAAQQLIPGEPGSYRLQGLAWLALAQHGAAMEAFDNYFAAGGKPDVDVFRARGQARMHAGRYLDAVDDYTRGLQLQPATDLYLHRGWAYFFTDAWRLALRDFAEVVEQEPANSDAYTGRGLARVMLGDCRQAVEDAEQALRCRPATPEMLHNIACIFAQAVSRTPNGKTDLQAAQLRRRYQQRALQVLEQALLMVAAERRADFWRNKVAPDAALDPVRQCPAFQRLAQLALSAGKAKH